MRTWLFLLVSAYDEDANLTFDVQADVNTRSYSSEQPNTIIHEPELLPMPLSSVRLVRKIRDPRTGIVADKIVSRLIPLPDEEKAKIRADFKAGAITAQQMKKRMSARTIPGSKEAYGKWILIPSPTRGKKGISGVKDPDDATLRFEVEEKTWTPTLLRAPMPDGVIDELRNKYSRFRTRHEPGYQLALEHRARCKAEYKAWVASGGGMLTTATKEARRVEREKLKEKGEPTLEKGEPTLEKEVLERIGEVMKGKGIEMTGRRRRDVERNLRKGGVRWGGGVEGPEIRRAGTAEEEEEEKEEEDDEDWEEEEEEEELIEDERPREEKRPTL